MSIIYRPDNHHCAPPRYTENYRYPYGTIWRCDECGDHRVSKGNGAWGVPFPWGPTARRIKRIEAGQ